MTDSGLIFRDDRCHGWRSRRGRRASWTWRRWLGAAARTSQPDAGADAAVLARRNLLGARVSVADRRTRRVGNCCTSCSSWLVLAERTTLGFRATGKVGGRMDWHSKRWRCETRRGTHRQIDDEFIESLVALRAGRNPFSLHPPARARNWREAKI